jgi:hypothetical protein
LGDISQTDNLAAGASPRDRRRKGFLLVKLEFAKAAVWPNVWRVSLIPSCH